MKFVSILNDGFVDGFIALLNSLIQNSGLDTIDYTIVEIGEGISSINKKKINSMALDSNVEVELSYFDSKGLGEIAFNSSLFNDKSKSLNINKLLIFNLPFDEPICYLDADMLCLSDIKYLKEIEAGWSCEKGFYAVPNIGKLPPKSIKNQPMFNAGLFVFRPDEEVFNEIKTFTKNFMTKNRNTDKKYLQYSDQRIINEFIYKNYPNSLKLLGFEWNAIITLKHHNKGLWRYINSSDAKFYHYTAIKPWRINPKTAYKDYKKRKGIRGKIGYIYDYISSQILYKNEIKIWKNYIPKNRENNPI
ncbi:glycosyltransferase [Methanonatronarchaeum sp. AMET-Sl]|uniref:glycosyltransferase n=1 Tax=Methanonatronarchaeum sp. AMET-Sl TaxID=3037654 RepID=UPI00244DA7FF|nr:glycosyltransferase [Methanonatronarchaeum sp. AMET-Sl]WGI17635.1 glycosyltransferase [Methanonatronarchaeum sp. AMET-Sl]